MNAKLSTHIKLKVFNNMNLHPDYLLNEVNEPEHQGMTLQQLQQLATEMRTSSWNATKGLAVTSVQTWAPWS